MSALRLGPRVSAAVVLGAIFIAAPSSAETTTHACVEAAHEGQRLRDAGKLTAARDAFVACSAAACPEVVRTSCERWGAELGPRIPEVVLGARDDRGVDLYEVKVSVDGRPLTSKLDGRAVPLDPGPHELLFEIAGRAPVKQFVVVREGEKVRGVVAVFASGEGAAVATSSSEAKEPATQRPSLVPYVIAGSVAGLGLTGFTVFGLMGQSERSDLQDTCVPSQTCARSDVDSARTKLIVADVSLVIGIAGAAVLGAMVLVPLFRGESPPPPGSKRSGASWNVGPTAGGAFGSLSYSY